MPEQKKSITEGLQSLRDKVGAVIDDLASLEVTTYSGSFTLTFSDIKEEGTDVFKIKSLLKTSQASLNTKLQLVAYSRFEIDSDASNIVRSDLTADDKVLLEAHTELVKAAQESRKAIFDFAKSLVKLP
jgi:hypothetical protein